MDVFTKIYLEEFTMKELGLADDQPAKVRIKPNQISAVDDSQIAGRIAKGGVQGKEIPDKKAGQLEQSIGQKAWSTLEKGGCIINGAFVYCFNNVRKLMAYPAQKCYAYLQTKDKNLNIAPKSYDDFVDLVLKEGHQPGREQQADPALELAQSGNFYPGQIMFDRRTKRVWYRTPEGKILVCAKQNISFDQASPEQRQQALKKTVQEIRHDGGKSVKVSGNGKFNIDMSAPDVQAAAKAAGLKLRDPKQKGFLQQILGSIFGGMFGLGGGGDYVEYTQQQLMNFTPDIKDMVQNGDLQPGVYQLVITQSAGRLVSEAADYVSKDEQRIVDMMRSGDSDFMALTSLSQTFSGGRLLDMVKKIRLRAAKYGGWKKLQKAGLAMQSGHKFVSLWRSLFLEEDQKKEQKKDKPAEQPKPKESGQGHAVRLIVKNKNNFTIIDKKTGQQVQSKQTLARINSQAASPEGREQLARQRNEKIQARRQEQQKAIQNGIQAAYQSYPESEGKLSKETLTKAVKEFVSDDASSDDSIWESCTAKDYFGQGIKSRSKYYRDYVAVVAFCILYFSINYRGQAKSAASDPVLQLINKNPALKKMNRRAAVKKLDELFEDQKTRHPETYNEELHKAVKARLAQMND